MANRSKSLVKIQFKNKTRQGRKSTTMEIDRKIRISELKVTLGHIFDLHPESFSIRIKGETSRGELEDKDRLIEYNVNTGDTLLVAYKKRNVKISNKAWEMLRRAKYTLRTRSYSETIKEMDKQLNEPSKELLKQSLKDFDEKEHRVKVPTDTGSFEGSKTILLDDAAIRILERIKLESNQSAFTYSDAIDFLVTKNEIN